MFGLNYIDISLIVLYFIIIFGVAIYISFKEKLGRDTSSYFLGGRDMGWFVIGASLFASNIGAEHLVGLAGSGASGGIAVAQFEIISGIILLLLGWVFVPFYLKSGIYTMPEFLEIRYSKGARIYLSLISIIAYILTKISVTIAATGIIFEAIGLDFWSGAVAIIVATGLYTMLGGLKAVLYTDMIQMFILIISSILITWIGLRHIGGWAELQSTAGPDFFSIWKPLNHPEFPWTGIIFGAPILGVWYWCTDQFIVQRVLAAKDIKNARRGAIFGGYLKMLPLFIFVIPGIIAYALSQKGILSYGSADQAFPSLVRTLLPPGIRGLVIAGLFAALMSSLSSVFNSCSTLFTLDIYKKIKPQSSEKRLVMVGQIVTFFLVILGVLWIPFIDNISNRLFTYLQSVQAYISPPIAAVFLLGIFFKRLNAKGAMASLLTGLGLGTARLYGEINKESLSGSFFYLSNINFLHFAILLFVLCVAILILVSLLTKEPDYTKFENITYNKTTLFDDKQDVWLSALLLIIIISTWVFFS
ncbi:MAG: sodium:solute symporter [Cyclobacteriaceae bacterium]|nr:sodium:solute symporter [Cyclobacteriaceae bacterium]